MSAHRRDLLLLLALCGILFLTALGSRDLWNPNEPIYGQAVVEMEQRGDWLVPWVNGRPFAEKPILYYWLALVSSRATGIDEWTLRAPTAAAGFLCVVGVWLLVLPYAGLGKAKLAAALMATEFLVFWSARTVQMDVFVCAATVGMLVPVSRVWDHRANAWKGWALAGIAAGLGFLAKGPVAWICPGLALAVYALATGRVRSLLKPSILAGVGTCLLVAAPWYVLLWASGRGDVLWEVLVRQNFIRFVEAWDHQEPWWYYGKYFWIDYAPWAPMAVLAVALPGRSVPERRLHALAWSLLLAVGVFFSLSDSKRSPYVLPIAVSVAVLGGEVAARFLENRLDPLRRNVVRGGAAVWGVLLVLCGGALASAGASRYPDLAGPARITGSVVAGAGIVLIVALFFVRRPRVLGVSALSAFVAVFLAGAIWALPAADTFKSARGIGEALSTAAGPDDRLMAYGIWRLRSNYTFYARRPIPPADSLEDVRDAWESGRRVWVLVEQDQVAGLRKVIGDVSPSLEDRVGGTRVFVFSNSRSAPGSPRSGHAGQ